MRFHQLACGSVVQRDIAESHYDTIVVTSPARNQGSELRRDGSSGGVSRLCAPMCVCVCVCVCVFFFSLLASSTGRPWPSGQGRPWVLTGSRLFMPCSRFRSRGRTFSELKTRAGNLLPSPSSCVLSASSAVAWRALGSIPSL